MPIKYINTTPHAIRFLQPDGTVETVQPCGTLINARRVERQVGERHGAALMATVFEPDPEGETELRRLERDNPDALIIGSVIAAQAYPGRVLAMLSAPGSERVPPDQKIMLGDRFSVF